MGIGRFLVPGGLLALALLSTPALAQYPNKPITVIVPFAAGGNTDGIARMAAQRLSERLGKQFVVENRPGAGGAIAAEMVARAHPDGYTLFVAALPVMAIVPAMMKVRYDPEKDFAPISNIATNPFALVVNKDIPVNTLQDFVGYVRARQGQLSYGSAGIGSLNHLSMALFLKQAGGEMVHVPYPRATRRPLPMSSLTTSRRCSRTCPTLFRRRAAETSACSPCRGRNDRSSPRRCRPSPSQAIRNSTS